MQKKEYPWQNLSLKNIKGERWEDIPGYEDYYQVSSHGRIKALEKKIEFFIPGKHLVSFWKPEKILSQGIAKRWNTISKENIFRLTVTLCVDQKMKTMSVSRLVWNVFVEPLDFTKDQLYISFKDGDGRNIYYKNLYAGNQSEIGKVAFKRKRFMNLRPYITESTIAKSGKSRRKCITQYDLDGNRISLYESVTGAEKATGASHSNISLAAKGKLLSAGGFIWRFGKGRKKINTAWYVKARKAAEALPLKPVTQYSLTGTRINIYPSYKAAARAVGCLRGNISAAALGKSMTSNGFIWRAGKGEKKIDTSFYFERRDKFAKMFLKKVFQYDLQGNMIKSYASIKEAAAALQCSPDTISNAAKGKQKKSKGCIWKFEK